MDNFSLAAKGAAEYLQSIPEAERPPSKECVIKAWNDAIFKLTPSENVRRKCCPKSTFLALSEVSYGVSPGTYVAQGRNSDGAREALKILRANPELIPSELWEAIRKTQHYDYQMHVLVALYKMEFVH